MPIWVRQKAAGNLSVPLKERPMCKLSLVGTHLGLQWTDSGSGGFRDIQGETELCGFWVRAGRLAVIVPVLSPSRA